MSGDWQGHADKITEYWNRIRKLEKQARVDAALEEARRNVTGYQAAIENARDEPVYGVTGPPVSAGGPVPAGAGGIFAVTRLREIRPGVWVPDRDDGGVSQEQADEIAVATAAKDPAAEIMLALSEPLGLSARELTEAIPDQPPGTCSQCHTGPRARNGADPLCWACLELHKLRVAAFPVAAGLARRAPSCTHGKNAAWVRDGRCTRCGQYAIRAARPGEHLVPAPPPRQRKGAVIPLVLGITLIYLTGAAHLPHVLGFIGFFLVIRALVRVVRR